MFTTKQAADLAGISPTSARVWGKQLVDFMSDSASPLPGRDRRYTEDDVAVLHTAKVMRSEGSNWDEITADLEAGNRILPPPQEAAPEEPKRPEEPAGAASQALVPAEVWEMMIAPYREQVDDLKVQREELSGQLDEVQTALLEAEKRAAAAEARAELLAAQEEERRRPWYKRLFDSG